MLLPHLHPCLQGLHFLLHLLSSLLSSQAGGLLSAVVPGSPGRPQALFSLSLLTPSEGGSLLSLILGLLSIAVWLLSSSTSCVINSLDQILSI